MNTAVQTFPKEFEVHFFRDVDKELLLIVVVCYTITLLACSVMMNIRLPGITVEDANKWLNSIAPVRVDISQIETVKPNKIISVQSPTEPSGNGNNLISGISTEAQQQQSIDAMTAVQSVGIFSQAGGRTDSRKGNGQYGGGAMEGGGSPTGTGLGSGYRTGLKSIQSGSDLGNLSHIVMDPKKSEAIAQLKAGGKMLSGSPTQQGKRLTLSQLRELPLEKLIERATVHTSSAFQMASPGQAISAKGRSKADVYMIVSSNVNQIRSCFQSMLRRDPGLEGSVTLSFTIQPNGKTKNVRILERTWTDTALGKLVEAAICERIGMWQFGAIDPTAGDLTVSSMSYVFTR